MNRGKFDCSNGITQILYSDDEEDIIVRTSTIKDWLIMDKLMNENSNAIGFVPNTYFEKCVWGGEKNAFVFICEANNDEVGFVYITIGKGYGRYAKIQQIAVRDDARRLQYGTALIEVCRDFCNNFGRIGFTLRCRNDLPSNNFWKALGFSQYGIWKKGRIKENCGFKASDDINLYKIELNEKILTLFGNQITPPKARS